MSKAAIVSIIGVVVVIGAGVGYFVYKPDMNALDDRPSEEESSRDLKELLATKDPQRCTFEHDVEGTESSGVVYIAGGKMRGDFESRTTAGTIKSHMLVMNDMSYMWSDGTDVGFKSSLTEGWIQDTNGPGQKPQAVDFNQKLEYDCDAWAQEINVFVVPTGVTFHDLRMFGTPGATPPGSGMMPGAGTSGQDMKAMQCAACDSSYEPERSQCRAALGC